MSLFSFLFRTNPLGMQGKIAVEYGELVEDLWSGKSCAVAPLKLRVRIRRLIALSIVCHQAIIMRMLIGQLWGFYLLWITAIDWPCSLSSYLQENSFLILAYCNFATFVCTAGPYICSYTWMKVSRKCVFLDKKFSFSVYDSN